MRTEAEHQLVSVITLVAVAIGIGALHEGLKDEVLLVLSIVSFVLGFTEAVVTSPQRSNVYFRVAAVGIAAVAGWWSWRSFQRPLEGAFLTMAAFMGPYSAVRLVRLLKRS